MLFKPKRPPGSLGHLDNSWPHRKDCKVLKVQDGVEVHVFWKQVGPVVGPACSVFVLAHEVIKFDCCEGAHAHFHVALPARAGSTCNMLRIDATTVEQQIDRTVFELMHNLVYYCERCVHPAVRAFSLDQSTISDASPKIRKALFQAQASCRSGTNQEGNLVGQESHAGAQT